MQNDQHTEQRTSPRNYVTDERSCHAAASAQTAYGVTFCAFEKILQPTIAENSRRTHEPVCVDRVCTRKTDQQIEKLVLICASSWNRYSACQSFHVSHTAVHSCEPGAPSKHTDTLHT